MAPAQCSLLLACVLTLVRSQGRSGMGGAFPMSMGPPSFGSSRPFPPGRGGAGRMMHGGRGGPYIRYPMFGGRRRFGPSHRYMPPYMTSRFAGRIGPISPAPGNNMFASVPRARPVFTRFGLSGLPPAITRVGPITPPPEMMRVGPISAPPGMMRVGPISPTPGMMRVGPISPRPEMMRVGMMRVGPISPPPEMMRVGPISPPPEFHRRLFEDPRSRRRSIFEPVSFGGAGRLHTRSLGLSRRGGRSGGSFGGTPGRGASFRYFDSRQFSPGTFQPASLSGAGQLRMRSTGPPPRYGPTAMFGSVPDPSPGPDPVGFGPELGIQSGAARLRMRSIGVPRRGGSMYMVGSASPGSAIQSGAGRRHTRSIDIAGRDGSMGMVGSGPESAILSGAGRLRMRSAGLSAESFGVAPSSLLPAPAGGGLSLGREQSFQNLNREQLRHTVFSATSPPLGSPSLVDMLRNSGALGRRISASESRRNAIETGTELGTESKRAEPVANANSGVRNELNNVDSSRPGIARSVSSGEGRARVGVGLSSSGNTLGSMLGFNNSIANTLIATELMDIF